MKVRFSEGMGALSGKYREVVYCHSCKYGYSYVLRRAYSGVDLRTITRSEIYANDLPFISIKRAVETGLLIPVKGWDTL